MIRWFRRWRIAGQVTSGLAGIIDRHQERRAEIGVNDWIYTSYGKFYMRISRRLLWLDQRGVMWCVDVAAVDILERYQRQGLFSAALAAIEDHTEAAGYDAVLVENVHNPDLKSYLLKRGYVSKLYDDLTFYKRMKADDD